MAIRNCVCVCVCVCVPAMYSEPESMKARMAGQLEGGSWMTKLSEVAMVVTRYPQKERKSAVSIGPS